MAQLIIPLSGIGGVAPWHYGDRQDSASSPNRRYIGRDDQYAEGVMNPLSLYGYMVPANNSFTDVNLGGGIDIIGSTIVDTLNSDGYLGGRDEDIYLLDSLTATTVSTHALSTITGARAIHDLEIYEINGTRHLFYAYAVGTGAAIGEYDFGDFGTAGNWNEDYISEEAGADIDPATTWGTEEKKMRVADNGFMFILDGPDVHKLDGTTDGGASGSLTENVLSFPDYFQTIDAVDIRGRFWIAINGSTRSLAGGANVSIFQDLNGIYVWDRLSTRVSMSDFIPISGIREIRTIFNFRETPWCFTISNNRKVQLRSFTGTIFKVVKEFDTEAHPAYHDSVSIVNDMIVWQGNDGFMYAYGKADPEQQRDGLYIIGSLTAEPSGGATYSSGGAILHMGADSSTGDLGILDAFYISFTPNNGTDNFRRWLPFDSSGTPHAGNVYTMVKPLPKLATVEGITFFHPPLGSTGSATAMTVDVYINQSTTAAATFTLTLNDGARGWAYFPFHRKNVNFIQLRVSWNTGTTIALSITPMYAQVDYHKSGKIR